MADEVAELQLFVEIVQAGNLSAAASAQLLTRSDEPWTYRSRVPPGRTSGHPNLQIVRTNRRGHSLFYERCERIVAEIADAEAEASSKGATVKGMLRIGAPMELGRRLVAPAHYRVQRKVSRCPGSPCFVRFRSGCDR